MEFFDAAARVIRDTIGSVNVPLVFKRQVVAGGGLQMVAVLPSNVVIRPDVMKEALSKVRGATLQEDQFGRGMICFPDADEEAKANLDRVFRSEGVYVVESRTLWLWLLFSALFIAAIAHAVVVPGSPLLVPFKESLVLIRYAVACVLGSDS